MAARDSKCCIGGSLPIVFALAIPCLVGGCGEDEKPAPVDQAQAKKAQNYMASYREQIIADNKAKAKAKAEGKKSP